LSFILIIQGCSFDNKTGIWTDGNKVQKVKKNESKDITTLEKNKKFKLKCAFILSKEDYNKCVGGNNEKKFDPNLEDVFITEKTIDYEKKIDTQLINLLIEKPFVNSHWLQENFSDTNNISNFYYSNKKENVFKSRALSKYFVTKSLDYFKPTKPLIFEDNAVSFDQKGTVYFYSIKDKKKVWEFNFYKKKFKKYNKLIFLHIYNNIVYAADNLGYIYALELNSGTLIWAKNFGIPFRSNIKLINDQIFIADQDNTIYSIDLNGDIIWKFATSPTFLKTDYLNNIILDDETASLIFYNTSGEMYSINFLNQNINWVVNTLNIVGNKSNDLLLSVPIILKREGIFLYNGRNLTKYNKTNGQKLWTKNISLKTKPVATANNLFVITKKDFLICLDSTTGEVMWSTKVFNTIDIKENKLKRKFGRIASFTIAQNELLLFTSAGQIISFDYRDGSLISYKKIMKFGLSTDPIIANGNLYLYDKRYKLYKFQ
ncbi:PQQ-like beta-propeller repeat protein, partial [Pelagibacteraceae bacterium]|nr:PQQ-like beta-propeller repeat protein [Pelagibacteraceae bacterium]